MKLLSFSPDTKAYQRGSYTYFVNSKRGTWVKLNHWIANKLAMGNLTDQEYQYLRSVFSTKFMLKNKSYNEDISNGDIKPLMVQLQSTGRCNYNCIYCFNDQSIRNCKMSIDTIIKTIEYAFENPYSQNGIDFVIYGGEPYLDKAELYQVFAQIKQKSLNRRDIKIEIVTNGSLLDDNDISYIIDNNIYVNYSYDGNPLFQKNNRIPFCSAVEENPLNNLKKFTDYKHLSVLVTVTREMATCLDEIALFLEEINIPCVEFRPVRLLGQAKDKSDLLVHSSDFIDSMKRIIELIEQGKIRTLQVGNIMRLLLPLETGTTEHGELGNHRCGAGRNVIFVKYDGTIQGCDVIPSQLSPIIGNVRDGITKLRLLDEIISKIDELPEHCIQCPWTYFCRSGCTGSSGSDEVSIKIKHALSCELNSELYPLLLEKITSSNSRMHEYFMNHYGSKMCSVEA